MTEIQVVGLRVIGARSGDAPVQNAEMVAWSLASPQLTLTQVAGVDGNEESLILGLLGSLSAMAAQTSLFNRVVLATWSDVEVATLPFLDMRMMQFLSDDDLGEVLDAWPWRIHVAEDRSRGDRQGVIVDFPLWPHVWHLDAALMAERWCEEYGVPYLLGEVMERWGLSSPEELGEWSPGPDANWRLAAMAHAEAVGVRLLTQELGAGVLAEWVDPKLV